MSVSMQMYGNYAKILKYKHKYHNTLHVGFEQITGTAWNQLSAAPNSLLTYFKIIIIIILR